MIRTLIALVLLSVIFPAPRACARETVSGGWYDADYPVPVMHLEGTIEEVARAHGALTKLHPGAQETLKHFAGAFHERIGGSEAFRGHPLAQSAIGWLYRHFMRNVMLDYLPERYRLAFTEFATAAGVPIDTIWDATVIPDTSLRLLSLLYSQEAAPPLPASFGCTSIIWNSGSTSVLHGRNLDYEGVGYWDRNPVIMHVIPSDGLAYVAVTALGIHAPGITAFNEAGLTLAVHQLTATDTQCSGTPVVVISAEVIRNARSIDDAIAIIRGFPRAGAWAYVISQGRDRAVVEASANEIAIRRTSEPFFYQTNHASSPAIAALQVQYSPGSWLDSFARTARLSKLSQSPATQGFATPARMASMLGLGDVIGEPSPPKRVAGGTIAKLDNIQSVIMDASHRRLWVSIGTDALAPNENQYLEYHWSDLRSADEPDLTGAEVNLSPRETLGTTNARLRALLHQTMDEKRVSVDPLLRRRLLGEYARIARESRSAPTIGTWPGLFLHAWEELKDGALEGAKLKQILSDIELALRDVDLSPTPSARTTTRETARHRLLLGRLTRAWLLDLLGRRGDALYEYYVIKRLAEFERMRAAAERGLKHPFNERRARALAIDRAGIDLYRY